MMNARTIRAGLVMAFTGWLLVAPAALAFPLSTCTLNLASAAFPAGPLDTASGPGAGGTQDDPFIVDWEGSVDWNGTTGAVVVKNGFGHVEVFGLPTPLRGETGPNDEENKSGSGTVGVAENAPFRFTGLYFVSGSLDVEGAPICQGSGWVKLAGDPVGTPPFFAGLASLIAGVALVLASIRGRHMIRGTIGGLLTGIGATIIAVIYSTLPLAENTPLVLVVGFTALGLVIGFIGGSSDTGSADAGSADAGPSDTGSSDTGSTEPAPPETPTPA
jgi:hypothetical protein